MPPEKTLSVWNILSRVIHLRGCQWKKKANVGTVGGLYLFTYMRIYPGSHWHPPTHSTPKIHPYTPPLSGSPQKRVTHLHFPLRHLGHDHPPGTENSTAAEIRAAPHASQSQSYSHAMAWQYGLHIKRGEKSYFSNTIGSWGKDGQGIFVARNI